MFLLLASLMLLSGCVQKSFEITPKQDVNAPPKQSSYDGSHQRLGLPQHQTPLFQEEFYLKHDQSSGDASTPPD